MEVVDLPCLKACYLVRRLGGCPLLQLVPVPVKEHDHSAFEFLRCQIKFDSDLLLDVSRDRVNLHEGDTVTTCLIDGHIESIVTTIKE